MVANERTRAPSPIVEKASILVVEHSSRDAERMLRGLHETAPHWEVKTAASGRDALQRLSREPVNAILLDRELPDADALDILDAIVERNYPAPVILMTGAGEAHLVHHALQEGAYDTIVKDDEHLRQLPQVVSSALHRYRLEQEHRRLDAALQTLRATSQALAASDDLEETQGVILEEAVRLFDAHAAWLMVAGPADDLEVAAWRGRSPSVAAGQRFPFPREWAERHAEAGQPVAIALPEARAWLGPSAAREAAGSRIEQVWVVPLLIQGGPQGLLVFFVGPPAEGAGPMPVDALRLLANLLAAAIENWRLRQRALEAEAELQSAQQKMVMTEKLRMLGAMASGIVHDFNNVLAIIKARAGLAKRRTGDTALLRDMDIISQAVGDGSRTVRRLQEMAGIYKARSLFAPVSVNRVVQSAVELTRPRWKDQMQARGIPLEVRLDIQPVPEVAGSEAELREGLINLIFNALDAMPEGGRLTIATRYLPAGSEAEAEGGVVISVQDTGHGMSPEVLAHAFDPFYSTKAGHNIGLGLSICRSIVTWHGGQIRAESRPGAGTTVTISLPAAAASAPSRKPADAQALGGPVRLLLIDDEQGVRDYFHDFFEAEGHTVACAATGDEGLAIFVSQPFDAVVTDLALPGLSGWEVARRVHARNPDLPILLLTGWGEPLDPETLKASGVTEVLKKPFDGAAILDFLVRYVRRD